MLTKGAHGVITSNNNIYEMHNQFFLFYQFEYTDIVRQVNVERKRSTAGDCNYTISIW